MVTDKQRKAVQQALARGQGIIDGDADDENCPLCDAFQVEGRCDSCPIVGHCMRWTDLRGAKQKAEQWNMMARAEQWLKDHPKPVPVKPAKRDVTGECELTIGSCSGAPCYKHLGTHIAYVTAEGWKVRGDVRGKGYSIEIRNDGDQDDLIVQVPHIFKED